MRAWSSNSENLGVLQGESVGMLVPMSLERLLKGNTFSKTKYTEQSSSGVSGRTLPSVGKQRRGGAGTDLSRFCWSKSAHSRNRVLKENGGRAHLHQWLLHRNSWGALVTHFYNDKRTTCEEPNSHDGIHHLPLRDSSRTHGIQIACGQNQSPSQVLLPNPPGQTVDGSLPGGCPGSPWSPILICQAILHPTPRLTPTSHIAFHPILNTLRSDT